MLENLKSGDRLAELLALLGEGDRIRDQPPHQRSSFDREADDSFVARGDERLIRIRAEQRRLGADEPKVCRTAAVYGWIAVTGNAHHIATEKKERGVIALGPCGYDQPRRITVVDYELGVAVKPPSVRRRRCAHAAAEPPVDPGDRDPHVLHGNSFQQIVRRS